MTLFEVLRKFHFVTLSKICLRLCPSAHLRINLRINWIISRIPRGISKIIFVQGSYESLAMLNGKTIVVLDIIWSAVYSLKTADQIIPRTTMGKTRQGLFYNDSIYMDRQKFWPQVSICRWCSSIIFVNALKSICMYPFYD